MTEFHLEDYLQQLSTAENIDDCPKVPIPPICENQNYLFVSYSHKDYKAVYSDLAHLYNRGVRFWYDKGLHAGREWEQEVEEHITDPNCCGIVFYVSTNLFLSESVLKEIEFTRKRKKGNIIFQKNYFCVNLHMGSISRILYDAQNIRVSNGEDLLDTKVVSTLTSTFSDSATYINANSKFHMDELVNQIQEQFDVTSQRNPDDEHLELHNLDTRKGVLRSFWKGKIYLVPLCKYMYTCYQENKSNRPWYLIPVTIAAGGVILIGTLLQLFAASDIPYVQLVTDSFNSGILVIMGILFCAMLWLNTLATLFWLYFMSPNYQKHARETYKRVLDHVFFLFEVLLAAFVTPFAYLLLLLFLKFFFELIEKNKLLYKIIS